MSPSITVAEVFRAVGLAPAGPRPWNSIIEEQQPGVYVLSLLEDPFAEQPSTELPQLPEPFAPKWLAGQSIVYIGRTRRALRMRLREFYRHKFGSKSPHRGGQAVLLLDPKPWVFWSVTNEPTKVEREMIEAFRRKTNALPFGNRCRGTALSLPT